MREERWIEQDRDLIGESKRRDAAGNTVDHSAHVLFRCDREFYTKEFLQFLEVHPLPLERDEHVVLSIRSLHEDVLALYSRPLECLLLLLGILIIEDRIMIEFGVGNKMLFEEANDVFVQL